MPTENETLPPADAVPVERWVGRLVLEARCWCHTCRPVALNDMRMVLCPDCGCKRCPKANDHRHACTDSNERGQPGSAYP